MQPEKVLEQRIASEAAAYGFSLTTWGVGALLIDHFGIPGLAGVLAYVVGAVAGYATLAVVAFGGVFDREQVETRPLIVASAIHVIATLGTLVVADAVLRLLDGLLVPVLVFGLGGYLMSVSYNLLLTVEAVFARVLA